LCGQHAADVLAFMLRTFDHSNVEALREPAAAPAPAA
jgi:hypothetical protein